MQILTRAGPVFTAGCSPKLVVGLGRKGARRTLLSEGSKDPGAPPVIQSISGVLSISVGLFYT